MSAFTPDPNRMAELEADRLADEAIAREAERLADWWMGNAGDLAQKLGAGALAAVLARDARDARRHVSWAVAYVLAYNIDQLSSIARNAIRAELARHAEAELRAAQESGK